MLSFLSVSVCPTRCLLLSLTSVYLLLSLVVVTVVFACCCANSLRLRCVTCVCVKAGRDVWIWLPATDVALCVYVVVCVAKMRVRMPTNGINNGNSNDNNHNNNLMDTSNNNSMSCSSSTAEIRIERETASSFSCGVSSVSSMSAEYTFSSAFRFGSKVWKLGAKRLKDVYSFLIYPMDVDEKSHEEGYSVQMVIVSPNESEDHILVQGRREFNNNATIFVWTASFSSLRPFLYEDTIYISFDMKTLPPGHIFSTDADLDFRDDRRGKNIPTMDKKTGTFPIILTGIRDISLNGISSPAFSFEGNQWELKMCQNGNLYAFRIMCNRKVANRFSVCAKIQLAVQSPPATPVVGDAAASPTMTTTTVTPAAVTPANSTIESPGFRTIHVEGSRRFRDSDDSMFWSFDKRLDKYVNGDALSVEMKITVYRPKDKSESPESTVCLDVFSYFIPYSFLYWLTHVTCPR